MIHMPRGAALGLAMLACVACQPIDGTPVGPDADPTDNDGAPSDDSPSDDETPRVPGRYTFSLSASATDPFANTAAPATGSYEIYLWLVCSNVGIAALEIDLDVVGDELPEEFFEPLAEHVLFITWEGSGDMDLAIGGCPTETTLLGAIHLIGDGSGASVCFEKGTENAGAIDCHVDPRLHGLTIYGFASDGSEPCVRWPEDGCVED